MTSEKEIKKRLDVNGEWFEDVSNGHQYGNLEKILEKHFSQRGVDKLKKEEDWFPARFYQS